MSVLSAPSRAVRGRARSGRLLLAGGSGPAVLVLLLAGILSMARQWGGHILWDPDSLFYQAKVIELRTGASAGQVLHQVFTGPLSHYMRSLEAAQPSGQPRLLNQPGWPAFSAPFYARRLLIPGLAALLQPLFGLRSLKLLSLSAYVLLGPLLFALLRRRFGRRSSLLAALACLWLPFLRTWATFPLTDLPSLALEVLALIAAARVLDRGARAWLAVWVLALGASSLTHDQAFIPIAAAGCGILFAGRRAEALLLTLTGIAAALPALLLVPIRENVQLASAFSQHGIPAHTSWSWVLGHYPANVGHMISADLSYASGHLSSSLPLLLGVALALGLGLSRGRRGDPVLGLILGVIAGYVVQLALGPSFSVLRYELVLVPVIALGYALGLERIWPERSAELALRS